MRDKFEFEQYVYERSEELLRQEKARKLLLRKSVVSTAAVICLFAGVFTAVKLNSGDMPFANSADYGAADECYNVTNEVDINEISGADSLDEYNNAECIGENQDETFNEGKENDSKTGTETYEDINGDGAEESEKAVRYFNEVFYYAPNEFDPYEDGSQVPVSITLYRGSNGTESDTENITFVDDYSQIVEICNALLTTAKRGGRDFQGGIDETPKCLITVNTGGDSDMTIDVYNNMIVADGMYEYTMTSELKNVLY